MSSAYFMRIMLPPMTVIIACCLGLLATPANAQRVIKTCAGVEVRSIDISAEVVRRVPVRAAPAEIEVLPAPAAAGKALTLIARGPTLGSMDSPNVETDLACTAAGFVLTATIARSANYHGAAAQNVNWYPRITIAVAILQPAVVFQATWRMRLTTGTEVHHAQTPPYPADQEYPIIVTKTVHSASDQRP
jgi:hypothetical protein